MSELTEFELAQKRLKDRQRDWFVLFLSSAIFCMTLVGSSGYGGGGNCWLPFQVLTAIMAASKALDLYYSSPKRVPRIEHIEQEMVWLFGDDWRDITGAHEYIFAQERIQKRSVDRWFLLLHIIVFLPGSLALVSLGTVFLNRSQWVGLLPLGIVVAWFSFALLPHCLRAFPTESRLSRRERRTGENLRRELRRMQPEKPKNEEKSKSQIEYTFGDDGELIELNESDDAKQKRDEA